jgi:hypothetical protein
MKRITITPIIHKGERRLKLSAFYRKGDKLDILIRKMPGRRWSKTKTSWHLPWTDDYEAQIKSHFKNHSDIKLIFGKLIKIYAT